MLFFGKNATGFAKLTFLSSSRLFSVFSWLINHYTLGPNLPLPPTILLETPMNKDLRKLLLATTAIGFLLAGPAHAADKGDSIKALQAQINELQKQLTEIQTQQKAQTATAAAPTVTGEGGKEILPGVKIKLGGYVETTGIWRDKNQTQDTSTSWNGNAANTTGIPFFNNDDSRRHEFRMSARASRLNLMTEGDVDKDLKLSAFIESDFLGAAPTANSIATNSYTPRLRHAFAQVDRNDLGLRLVGGQTWSLATLNSSGADTLKTLTTVGIDSGYLPGTVYDRAPQVRLVKSFADKKVNLAISAEEPEVNFGQVTPPAIVTARTTGVSSLNTGTTYSTDLAPDVIAKLAYDPGFGHYEVIGLMRFFEDTINADNANHTVVAGGGGVGAYLPFLSKKLEVQATFLGGQGIGRYTAGGMPDFSFESNGAINPLPQISAMVGFVGHPDPTWDLYTYAGFDKVYRHNEANILYGYGDYALNNATCYVDGGACTAQTSSLWQVSPGLWKRFYKGDYGTLQAGASYALTRRNTFSDANGNAPHAYQSVVMTALRYSPFK
jgi:hypothetical protein